ncbi:PREDICTED: syntaxin-112-like [Ipomoea nil]|uniref:syntaxin-112-like n=1 Tax=Ipomoea nil TaxID=35883 RepID=UPI00090167D8|nr:PREDICTED: syntaxin-112-like [Ipomoea nil]
MNDLMTKSFMSYVELKKQAMKDLESGPVLDIEMGQLDPSDEKNLSKFFEDVGAIKADMEEISNLLLDLHDLNEETKSAQSAKILHGLRDRTNSDMVTVLRKAKIIKTKLELLDKSNLSNRSLYKEGTPIDRTRMSVTNGLRQKLRDLMNDFQCLRGKIVAEHKEGLKRSYYTATGTQPSEETIEKMMEGGKERVFEGKAGEMAKENEERNKGVKEIQKSLAELHQVFLDMAVMVETQGEQMNNIEQNVVNAGAYVKDGVEELNRAKQMKKKRRTLLCWVGVIILAIFLVFLLAILF